MLPFSRSNVRHDKLSDTPHEWFRAAPKVASGRARAWRSASSLRGSAAARFRCRSRLRRRRSDRLDQAGGVRAIRSKPRIGRPPKPRCAPRCARQAAPRSIWSQPETGPRGQFLAVGGAVHARATDLPRFLASIEGEARSVQGQRADIAGRRLQRRGRGDRAPRTSRPEAASESLAGRRAARPK